MSTLKRIQIDSPLPLVQAEGGITIGKDGARIEIDLQNGDTRTLVVTLAESGAALQILVKGHLQESDSASFDVTVVHAAPHTRAETIILTALHGSSRVDVRGLLRIAPGAYGSESFFNHHSLVFDNAQAHTWPALEIENNEVKCSHAATVKTITDADLFYPRSRGIEKQAAIDLLTEAFLTL